MGLRLRAPVTVAAAAAVLVAAAAAPAAAAPAGSGQVTVTYTVETRGAVRGDVEVFRRVVAATLADPRGWSLGGAVIYTPVRSGGQMRVVLASPSEVDRAHPVCSPRYSCQVGDAVLVNDDRWRTGTSSWPYSLDDYRQYVVNHEVGHWLDLGHRSCPGPGRAAPVMQQQSISLQGCRATVWPLADEREAVARRLRVQPVRTTDAPAVVRREGADLLWVLATGAAEPRELRSVRWGRPARGDVPVAGDWDGDGVETAGVARPDGDDWLWLLTDSATAPRRHTSLRWGRPRSGDVPVVGDWDGDGRDSPGVVRRQGADLLWLTTDRTDRPRLSGRAAWGRPASDDRPVVGDWDGDGRDTPGVVRRDGDALRWLLTDASRSSRDVRWGRTGDLLAPGDGDGDGIDSPAVARPAADGLEWLLTDDLRRPGEDARRWGRSDGDVPLRGRW